MEGYLKVFAHRLSVREEMARKRKHSRRFLLNSDISVLNMEPSNKGGRLRGEKIWGKDRKARSQVPFWTYLGQDTCLHLSGHTE